MKMSPVPFSLADSIIQNADEFMQIQTEKHSKEIPSRCEDATSTAHHCFEGFAPLGFPPHNESQ